VVLNFVVAETPPSIAGLMGPAPTVVLNVTTNVRVTKTPLPSPTSRVVALIIVTTAITDGVGWNGNLIVTLIIFSAIPPATTIIAKGDSAASNHYFALRDSAVLDDVHFDGPSTSVILPDSSSLHSVANGQLPLSSSLTPRSKKTTVFHNLQSSLISLGYVMTTVPSF
jgi:hypothetical protein